MYRWLNKKTIRNRYPLPLPEEMFDRLGGSRVFSKIDLQAGYWQMPIQEQAIQKTAFKTCKGLFEYLVMPFGVTNAPAQFMHLMKDVLRNFLDTFVMVFLDNILVHSKFVEEHAQHLRSVLEKLRQYQQFAKAPKCCFTVFEIDFLGEKVTPASMSPTEEKIRAVREWQRPNDIITARSFLGFPNFY